MPAYQNLSFFPLGPGVESWTTGGLAAIQAMRIAAQWLTTVPRGQTLTMVTVKQKNIYKWECAKNPASANCKNFTSITLVTTEHRKTVRSLIKAKCVCVFRQIHICNADEKKTTVTLSTRSFEGSEVPICESYYYAAWEVRYILWEHTQKPPAFWSVNFKNMVKTNPKKFSRSFFTQKNEYI